MRGNRRNVRNVVRRSGRNVRQSGMSRRRFLGGAAAAVAGATIGASGVAHATPTEIHVYGPGTNVDVQNAVYSANNGDKIILHGTFQFGGSIVKIYNDIEIIGQGATIYQGFIPFSSLGPGNPS